MSSATASGRDQAWPARAARCVAAPHVVHFGTQIHVKGILVAPRKPAATSATSPDRTTPRVSLRFPGHVCKHCGDIEHSRRPNSQELETDGRTQGSVHYPQGHTDQTTQHQPHIDTLIAKSALREYVFMILGNSCATLLFVQGGDH
jgi:hypothetical protein